MSVNISIYVDLHRVSEELLNLKQQLATLQAEMAVWKQELQAIVAREAVLVSKLSYYEDLTTEYSSQTGWKEQWASLMGLWREG